MNASTYNDKPANTATPYDKAINILLKRLDTCDASDIMFIVSALEELISNVESDKRHWKPA